MFKIKFTILVLLVLLVVTAYFFRYRSFNQASITVSYKDQTVKMSDTVEIPIMLDTAGATINAVEVYLNFDPKLLTVKSVSREGSFLKLWLTDEPKFSNENGQISFAGGLPTPGFNGRGKIGSVVLEALKPGQLELIFDPRTKILLNDGVGTTLPLKQDPIRVKVVK